MSLVIKILGCAILQSESVEVLNCMGLTNKYCHAEFDSASTLYTVHRFRNEFGMTLRNELFGQPIYFEYGLTIF